jgi:hypothetical protein
MTEEKHIANVAGRTLTIIITRGANVNLVTITCAGVKGEKFPRDVVSEWIRPIAEQLRGENKPLVMRLPQMKRSVMLIFRQGDLLTMEIPFL